MESRQEDLSGTLQPLLKNPFEIQEAVYPSSSDTPSNNSKSTQKSKVSAQSPKGQKMSYAPHSVPEPVKKQNNVGPLKQTKAIKK